MNLFDMILRDPNVSPDFQRVLGAPLPAASRDDAGQLSQRQVEFAEFVAEQRNQHVEGSPQ